MIPQHLSARYGQYFDLGRIEPYWQRGRIWWSERSLREQILLGALTAAAIFALLLVAVIAPLRAARAEALADIRDAGLLEARLRAGGPDLARTGRMRRGTASAIITDSAAAARIVIQRIEPEGGNTRIVLGDAPFDQVLGWIAELEQTSRLRASEATIERKGAPGMVSATLVLTD